MRNFKIQIEYFVILNAFLCVFLFFFRIFYKSCLKNIKKKLFYADAPQCNSVALYIDVIDTICVYCICDCRCLSTLRHTVNMKCYEKRNNHTENATALDVRNNCCNLIDFWSQSVTFVNFHMKNALYHYHWYPFFECRIFIITHHQYKQENSVSFLWLLYISLIVQDPFMTNGTAFHDMLGV